MNEQYKRQNGHGVTDDLQTKRQPVRPDDARSQEPLGLVYPALLSDYHQLEKIGHGAQATMLKALDAQNHPVAIKVLDYSKASDWKDIELFEREIDVLKNLHIDGVPKYIKTIKTNTEIYLVEEYIDALSLENQMKQGRVFSVNEVATILIRTAAILKQLSDCIPPIVHRDIKPANILVDKDLNVYLVDFGVVANTKQTVSMTFAGTAGYVAPEQLYGKSAPTSDIFSLGATMLYLISRTAPCDMQLNGIVPDFDKYIPETVPDWLSDLIKQMMSVNPADRPQNGGELIKLILSAQGNADSIHGHTLAVTPKSIHGRAAVNKFVSENNLKFLEKKTRQFSAAKWITGVILFLSLVLSLIIGSWGLISSLVFYSILIILVFPLTMALFNTYNNMKQAGYLVLRSSPSSKLDLSSLTETANAGDVMAQLELGYRYDIGSGVAMDKRKAAFWYLKAAEQKHPVAQYNVGTMIEHGEGCGKDPQNAVNWYIKSANQGYARAQYQLGVMYDKGLGIKKDKTKAQKWYKKAEEQGYNRALPES